MPAKDSLGEGTMSLFIEISIAIVRAEAMYEHVSSSAQCFPGAIQGMLTMNAKTISGERFLLKMISRARSLQ
jgi:hypothetical protein